MSSSENTEKNGIDWNEMAETFDRWLPYIQPVADALIDIADIREGDSILDVASGTGEPSLSLARRYRDKQVSILGVDNAAEMVRRATQKVEAGHLSGLRFQQMQAEALTFSDGTFDRVISRFGVMLFDDPLRGVKQMRRVLKAGEKVALAVWGEFHEICSLHLIWDLLMSETPLEKRPPLPRIGRMGAPGKLKTLLSEAGFRNIEVKPFLVTYRFDDFASYWSVSTTSGLLKEPLDTFSPERQQSIQEMAEVRTIPFRKNGALVFQNQAILASAIK